jgi:hypothetical protein
MDFNQLNALLKNLDSLRNGKKLLEREVIHEIEDEGRQGDEGVTFEVYKLPEHNLHVRLKITTDSYGANEKISGIEFVQPIEKTITRFESI